MRFKAGVDSHLNVLVARNSLFAAQLTLVSLQLSLPQNEFALYKALGGGWEQTRRKIESIYGCSRYRMITLGRAT
jgi:multidrug efflux system outer membrane protein